MNTGDTAFVLVSTALVFFMTPGLALFYGGMVRRKNVLNTIMSVILIQRAPFLQTRFSLLSAFQYFSGILPLLRGEPS